MSGTRDEAIKLLDLYYKHFSLLKVTTVEKLFVLWEPFVERIHCISTSNSTGNCRTDDPHL